MNPSLFSPFESTWLGDAGGGGSWLRAMRDHHLVLLLLMDGEVCLTSRPGSPSLVYGPNRILWINTDLIRPDRLMLTGEGRHSALMLSFPVNWVRKAIADLGQELSADMRGLLLGHAHPAPWLERRFDPQDRAWAQGLMAPTLCSEARRLLEGSRINEFFFSKVLTETRGEEFFCSRTRRLAMDRVEIVRKALLEDLEMPPSLKELAALCHCNPHYLSRTFTEAAGKTISRMLRELRIDRAAELIAAGSHNVSEAALEVGYRSLSHFSHAFRSEKGLPPSKWLRSRLAPTRSNDRRWVRNDRQRAVS